MCGALIRDIRQDEAPTRVFLFVFVFFERNGAVEDQVFGSGIGVNVVIAGARELQIVERLERLDIFFDKGTVVDMNAVGIACSRGCYQD